MDLIWRQVLRRNAAKAENRALTSPDSRPYGRAGGKPDPILEDDRLDDELKIDAAPIVTARAEVGALRYAAMIADLDGRQIVQPDPLAYPAVVSDIQSPGEFHPDPGFDGHVVADPCAEERQHEATERIA